jgi:hypothetical protein
MMHVEAADKNVADRDPMPVEERELGFRSVPGDTALAAAVEEPLTDPAAMREKILALENTMRQMPQVEIQTTHHFAPGIYMREIFIPKGVTLTGKIHRTEHMNILSQGDLSVLTENGIKRLKASTVVKSHPGIKRVGYAHEDSVWITVHPNPSDERDTAKLEETLIARSFDELSLPIEKKQIQGED